MRMWFPGRRLIFVGDAGYGTHEGARFAHRPRLGLTLVSKLHPQANLFGPPPPYSGQGRPRVKGPELPKPAQVVQEASTRTVLDVAWHGGERRRVEVVTAVGWWYKGGRPLIAVRWVFVRDRT